jgi:alpha-tubulin suppressor-like RCC1 family protein/sortase (surface protein transpeptidase)
MVAIDLRRITPSITRIALTISFLATGFFVPPGTNALASEPSAPSAIGDSIIGQSLSVGFDHTCGVTTEGRIHCWGEDSHGQLAVPSPNTNFIQVSAGVFYTCGLKSDGTVVCWGDSASGKTTVPAYADFTQVSAGESHTCGRRSDSSIECWGSSAAGKTTVPADNTNFTHVSAGWTHTCGRKIDGSLVCWGDNFYGQTTLPSPNSGFAQVSAGSRYTCGLKTDGSVICWGSSADGLPDGPATNSNFTQISAGQLHACGRKQDGSLECWGSAAVVWTPLQNTDFVQVSAGSSHTCGLKSDGSVVCDGMPNSATRPPNSFLDVSAGENHSCGVRWNGSVVCWGLNHQGQLNVPGSNTEFIRISAGGRHTCALKRDGSIVCWGYSGAGATSVPTPNTNFTAVSVGRDYSCGLKSDGSIVCWGDNFFGQTSVPSPNTGFSHVSAGTVHTCGRKASNGEVICWGDAAWGKSTVPSPVTGFSDVDAGWYNTCGRKSSNQSLVCWGENTHGENNIPAPNQDFIGHAVGLWSVCAIRYTGSVNVWGYNLQAGTVDCWGQIWSLPNPNQNFIQVSGMAGHYCGLRGDEAVCWGHNDYGQTNVPHVVFQVPLANTPPSATDDSYVVNEDSSLVVSAASGLLVNDSDPEGDPLDAIWESGPSHGTLDLHNDGSFTYDPDPDYFGPDSFTYHATDGFWDSSAANVTIDVTSVNDPPTFTPGGDVTVPRNSGAYSAPWASSISPGPANEAGQTITTHVTNDNPSLFATQPAISSGGVLTFSPNAGVIGTAIVGVSFEDNGGTANGGVNQSMTFNFWITIAPFPTVGEVIVTGNGVVIPPGGTVVGRITRLSVGFDMDIDDPPGDADPEDVTNPFNYMLLQRGSNGVYDTTGCAGGVSGDDVDVAIGPVQYDQGHFRAILWVNNGGKLPDGNYRLYVCGTTSITAAGIALGGDGVNSGTDFRLDFTVIVPPALPETGFAPGVRSALPEQPYERSFTTYANLRLEIPSIGIADLPIIGVPRYEGSWDVSWLGSQAGWLAGSAFPTWPGNTVLTAHVFGADGLPGPFVDLGYLRWGDRIAIRAWGQRYIYEVRQNFLTQSTSSYPLQHEEYDWVTLLTCERYDEASGNYAYRRVVRAVLIDVLPDWWDGWWR